MFHIYTKENCPFCTAAKKLLSIEGQEFIEYIFDKDYDKPTFNNRFPGVTSVPFILHDEYPIGGYSELLKYLADQKGHI